MPNQNLFSSSRAPAANTTNAAGGRAYSLTAKQALAQIACTGTFNGTYYTDPTAQLKQVERLCNEVEPEFLAKLALYARQTGYMKDMPAYMVAVLSQRDPALFRRVFNKVINNGKMLRHFVQIARSGALGKKVNLSAAACRKAMQKWFDSRSLHSIFQCGIGNSPTLTDIIKMARPVPGEGRDSFFKYLLGKSVDRSDLPDFVRQYEALKAGESAELPRIDFRYLANCNLSTAQWTQISRDCGWTALRMNLNTFARHGVFENASAVDSIASRLQRPEEIAQAGVFPYQLLAAYKATESNPAIPQKIKNALQYAMEIATKNVPEFTTEVNILVDVSGSMQCPVTGGYGSAPASSVSCVDVAGLFASTILRKNPTSSVLPFDTAVRNATINPMDSVMTNARKLAINGGGTDCGCAIAHLNATGKSGDIVMVSDNESWVQSSGTRYWRSSTNMAEEWAKYKRRNPSAKLVLIDIRPGSNSQMPEATDVLRVGGFSDNVFGVVNDFLSTRSNDWVGKIEETQIPALD